MATINNYTTRQAASIGLQPGNLIGETHYVTENEITPPIKQRIRSTKLLSTNISRCQCCCPPIASSLCRSCLCPCWAYLLIGLLLALLVAALAVEVGLLSREKVLYRQQRCRDIVIFTVVQNETFAVISNTSSPPFSTCAPYVPVNGIEPLAWSSFSYIFLLINVFVYFMKS